MPENTDVVVRSATTEDLEAVSLLWEQLVEYHHHLDSRFWKRAPDGRDKFRNWMEEGLSDTKRALFVAESSGQIVGFVHGMLKHAPPPMIPRCGGFITDLVVGESRRGAGLGRKIFQAIERWFASEGAQEITLTTAVRNAAAVEFWKSMEFEPWTYTMWKPVAGE